MAWGDEGGEPFECQILGGCAVVEIEIPWNLFVEWNDSGRGGEGGGLECFKHDRNFERLRFFVWDRSRWKEIDGKIIAPFQRPPVNF